MKSCMEGKATTASKTMKDASEDEKKTWKTGGDAAEWEAAKEKGAQSQGADKMKSCIEGKATTASKTMQTASEDEKKTWKTECDADAKADFEAAGGDAAEWEAAKEKGAQSKGADKMKSCIEGKATTASKTMQTASE